MALSAKILWPVFLILILGAVSFDLFFLGKRKREMSLKEAGLWTLAWISLALFFNLFIYLSMGGKTALEYLTAYLLEKSLSLDNLFVFLVIFSYFDLPPLSQQKVLKWGILGAFLMRALFIFGGIWLLESFHFMFYLFGGFLIFSGLKLIFQKEEEINPQKNLFLKLARKIVPASMSEAITAIVLALILIETSDLVFALDSIPAVLAITRDPFIAYTSNGFAILGLRAFYFFLAGFLPKFIHLKKGVIILLILVGLKMIIGQFYEIPLPFFLGIIVTVIASSILLSLRVQRKNDEIS